MKKEKSSKEKLNEALAICKEVCEAKGWRYSLRNKDDKKWRFATIGVSRDFNKEYGSESVSAEIEIQLGRKLKLSAQKTSFYSYGIQPLLNAIDIGFNDLEWRKTSTGNKSKLSTIETILSRFDKSVRQLKRRYNGRPAIAIKDEYDVQDFLHSILLSLFEDIRPEEYTPSYAGSASRTDFLLKKEKVVIETKMTNKNLKDKKLGEQLIIDIKKYQVHPDCKKLYCLVYDPDTYISNPVAIENDLNGKHDNLDVMVFIVPK